MKNLLISAAAATAVLTVAPAYAVGTTEQISMCASALEEQGLAPANVFKQEFVSIKGASLRTVTMKLIPLSGGEVQLAECQIKRGKVIGAAIKA